MRRIVGIILFSLPLIFLGEMNTAMAKIDTNLQLSNSVSSGKWAAQLANASGAGTTSSYSITWSASVNKQYDLMSIINTGTFDLTASHITFSSAKTNGDITNPPSLSFDTCSGTWDTATFACSGTITTVSTGTGGSVGFNRYIATGSRLVVRITNSRSANGNYVTTINSQVFRSDIRTGIVVNS